MKGTKANARARVMHGSRREVSDYQAPFMRRDDSFVLRDGKWIERESIAGSSLLRDVDPRGYPYWVTTGDAALPLFVYAKVAK